MKRLFTLLAWVLLCVPLAAQPVTIAPAPALSGVPALSLSPVTLPQGFLEPQTLRASLQATQMTRRRLAYFRARFPRLSSDNVEMALQAAQQLEHSLITTIRSVEGTGASEHDRAALTAGALEQVRTSLAYWEASVSAPDVKTLLDQPMPEQAQERSRQSLRQLARFAQTVDPEWAKPVAAPRAGSDDDQTPLKAPAQMELLWNMMPASLASVARAEYGRAYNEAYYDGLTGIHSRRYLDHHAGVFAEEGDQHQLVGDVDHFKKVNDEMGGHQIGDKTLKAVATIWGQELEKAGEVGVRWGGEEFWGRVRGGEAKAVEVANRINARVRDEVHKQVGLPKPLTISIGIAGTERKPLNTKLEDFHATFKRADDAVFDAKHKGRDRVVVQVAQAFLVRYAPPAPPAPAAKGILAFLLGAFGSLLAALYRRRG